MGKPTYQRLLTIDICCYRQYVPFLSPPYWMHMIAESVTAIIHCIWTVPCIHRWHSNLLASYSREVLGWGWAIVVCGLLNNRYWSTVRVNQIRLVCSHNYAGTKSSNKVPRNYRLYVPTPNFLSPPINIPHLGLHSTAANDDIGLIEYALSHGQPWNNIAFAAHREHDLLENLSSAAVENSKYK